MIHVIIEKRFDSMISAIELSGHAESGPYGYDLVCAGVSSVVFGGINALIEIGQYEPEITQASDGGFIRCVIPSDLSETQREKTQLLLKGLIVSLKTLEASYGEHIKLSEKEV